MDKPIIEIAEKSGVCFGVERALRLAESALKDSPQPVYTLGALIHNPIVVAELEEQGICLANQIEDADCGTLVIRAHGVPPQTIIEAEQKGLTVIDATCPFVKRAHDAVDELVKGGYQVVILGEPGHPEVEGIKGHAAPDAFVISSPDELTSVNLRARVGLVVQTTQTEERLQQVVSLMLPHVHELRVYNTICAATRERQEAAAELAADCDVMIVIGGKNSGNTRRLADICSGLCLNTHHIQSSDELEPSWFENAKHIGITAGASTPQSHIQRIVQAIEQLTA